MISGLAYLTLLVLSGIIVAFHGQKYERYGMLVMIAGSVASAKLHREFLDVEINVMLIDGFALILLTLIAIKSDRFWPLWLAGFQSVALLTHAVRLKYPEVLPNAYLLGDSIWATFQLTLLLIVSLRIHTQAKSRRNI
jgi:cytochrome bd-type quinol oxidase subunit 2